MVKNENANISTPRSEPDVPPGFPPRPSDAGAAESFRNRNPTCTEKGFRLQAHEYSSGYEEQPRRTSRKRSRPQFYTPPVVPKTPRPRGRPKKARSMSQLSHGEIETRNSNGASSTPSRRSQQHMSCYMKARHITKENLSLQAHNQVGEQGSRVTTSSSPHLPTKMKGKTRENIVVDQKRARATQKSTSHTHDAQDTVIDISLPTSRHGCYENGTTSQGIDPKILQHVANALQYMVGSQSRSSSDIDQNLVHTLKAINKKHGDITQDCSLESDCMKTLVLCGICKVVHDLHNKQLKDLSMTTLDSCYTAVKDAENMKMNVQWLRNRLDEIKDAVKLASEAKVLVNEKNRRLEDIDKKKKELLLHKVELERLRSEIQDLEDQVAQEVVMVQVLNENIGAQTSKISRFQHMYLMDGLL